MGCTLFLCGDIMTGRGIDQIQPRPSDPVLYEPFVQNAEDYVELAEARHGPIPRQVNPDYIWGEALAELGKAKPVARIINLETAITVCNDAWPGKMINYRMQPANIDCLTAAKVDCCTLANNHVLDWGRQGLNDTISELDQAGIAHAGAGATQADATAPAILVRDNYRILVFSMAMETSGVPDDWSAGPARAGVQLLPGLSADTVRQLARNWQTWQQPDDLVVASIHWGGNWGYEVDDRMRGFARLLVDEAGVDIVHGHSSHHPRPLEVYRDRLLLYGCGDLINDYEGIGGYVEYRGELSLLYLPQLDDDGALQSLVMLPMHRRRFRLERATREEAEWLRDTLDRESRPFGTNIDLTTDNKLMLRW